MQLVFTTNEIPVDRDTPSVFLAGPTPRSEDVPSWRPEAIGLFKKIYGVDIRLFIPEPNWQKNLTFADVMKDGLDPIIAWEHAALSSTDAILMWVPRDLNTMPAFTTNIEFGMFIKSGKIIYGRPDEAPKNDYLDYCYERFTGNKPANTLDSLIKQVSKIIK